MSLEECLDKLELPPLYELIVRTTILRVQQLLYYMPRDIQKYTDHGLHHSQNLMRLICQFVNNWAGKPFSNEEKFLLVLSAWLHDLGCLIGREGHSEKTLNLLSQKRFNFLEEILDNATQSCLKHIIISHTHDYDLEKIPETKYENIRLRLICATFRLMDWCDISHAGANPVLYDILKTYSLISEDNIKYWETTLSIRDISFQGNIVNILILGDKIKEAGLLIKDLQLEELNRIFQKHGMSFRIRLFRFDQHYPERVLEELEIPREVPEETESSRLIKRLTQCPKGRKGWQKYQIITEEILTYLFPQLGKPISQSRTESGLHIRDFILQIPFSASGFWDFCRRRHDSVGLLVECKDYDRIMPNDVVITSKYLKNKGLGTFGILLTREKPSSEAIAQTLSLWHNDDKLIVILDDGDIVNMIKLKEEGKDPEIIIDKRIFEYRKKIE